MIRTLKATLRAIAIKHLALPCSRKAASVLAENLSVQRFRSWIGLGTIHAAWYSLNRRYERRYEKRYENSDSPMLLSVLFSKRAADSLNQPESILNIRSGERRYLAAIPR
jgi:hypothetical protein